MITIPEEEAARLVTVDDAIPAVRDAFIALGEGAAEVFPVASGTGSDPANGFAVKSGRIDGVALGVKVGTYWPGNVAHAQLAHASTVLLLDDTTGYPIATIGASHLTALRTAAVDAVAVDALAPPGAATLAVIGTGHQAFFDALAISRVRDLHHVAVWGRDPARARSLASRLAAEGLPAEAATLEDATSDAELVTTVTSSRAPVLRASHLGAIAHVSAMGADSPGKQELGVDVVDAARCYADIPHQSVTIGELQHAAAVGHIEAADVTPLGAVLTGRAPGRRSLDDLTLFDSSGTAVQDLAMAHIALQAFLRHQP